MNESRTAIGAGTWLRLAVAGATVLALTVFGLGGTAGAGNSRESADVFEQGDPGGAVLAADSAQLIRGRNGLSVNLSMPTPEPGSYVYPQSGLFDGPGHPEGFTLWVFVFNFPEDCSGGMCDASDLGDTPAQGGAFLGAGHMVGGQQLTLSGQVSVGDTPFGGVTLQDPMGAQVHLAVAPHGGLDSSLMPGQIKTPTGPGPAVWWVVLFD